MPSSNRVMKLTAQTIIVRLPMSLVSRNIIHKFWEMRLANRWVKPCKESMTPMVVQSTYRVPLGDGMLRTAVVPQSQRCNKWSKKYLSVSQLTGFFVFTYQLYSSQMSDLTDDILYRTHTVLECPSTSLHQYTSSWIADHQEVLQLYY